MQIGIVGLPNVGKSTLFKALTKKVVDASNYPFCTIDPNVGIVAVPDERLEKLAQISKSEEIIPTTIEFVDIAGLVKNAHKGEGLGNKFLSHIREVDAIVEVLRDFSNNDIIHVEGKVDPERDREIISLELVMADLQTVDKKFERVSKDAKSGDKELIKIAEILKKVKEKLENGEWANELNLSEKEKILIRDLNLLTLKPLIHIYNISGNEEKYESLSAIALTKEDKQLYIDAKKESEYAGLTNKELEELGIKQTGLDKLIKVSYNLLNLITFLTTGEKETRAWTVKRNTPAQLTAGVIHTDFIKGFIRAEVIKYEDFIKHNGEIGAKEKGLMRVEGKDYIVQDGDIMHFRISN
ncbi:redox-regulated ATPase YchF [Patescibacteria group bacterium]